MRAIHDLHFFLWALFCACLGVSCEYAAQGLIYAGHWLQNVAEEMNEYALRISEWDV